MPVLPLGGDIRKTIDRCLELWGEEFRIINMYVGLKAIVLSEIMYAEMLIKKKEGKEMSFHGLQHGQACF